LAWNTGEQSKLEQWAKFDRTHDINDDPYVVIGRSLGHPEETARDYGKIADLAFGFGGGAGAYKNFAPEDDTATDAEIEAHKQAWRVRHPRTKQFWYGVEGIAAIQRAPQEIDCGRFTLVCENLHGVPFLYIRLPSGRDLAYPFAKLITNARGYPAVSFMDNAQIVGGWAEVRGGRGVWGGTFTENVVHAVARDLLAAAMQRLEAAGYPVVLHVHDEIVCELPTGEGSLEEFKYLIERLPEWAAGMPIAAKVRNGPRFAEAETNIAVVHVADDNEVTARTKPHKRLPQLVLLSDAPVAPPRLAAGHPGRRRHPARFRRPVCPHSGVGDRARRDPAAQRNWPSGTPDHRPDPGGRALLQRRARTRSHNRVGYNEHRRETPR
jgi:hypothetical protein